MDILCYQDLRQNPSLNQIAKNLVCETHVEHHIEILMRENAVFEEKVRVVQREFIAAQVTADLEREKIAHETIRLKQESERLLSELVKVHEILQKKEDEESKIKEEAMKLNTENQTLKENKLPDASDLEKYTFDRLEAAEETMYQLLKHIRERKVKKSMQR